MQLINERKKFMFISLNKKRCGRGRRGFSLVELAIVLGVASLLFAGLWRLMASGNAQLRDQTAADQHRQLIAGVSEYLASTSGQTLLTGMALNVAQQLALPAAAAVCVAGSGALCEFLPTGFHNGTTNAYAQLYSIRIRKDSEDATSQAPITYSFIIITSAGDVIPDTSGGRISSMIGGDGGFIYAANVCGLNWACGAYDAWAINPTIYGFGAGVAGHVASRTYISGGAASDPWLARVDMPPIGSMSDLNTIQTDISLGGNTLLGATVGFGGAIEQLSHIGVDATSGAALFNSNTMKGGNATVIIGRTGCGIGSTFDLGAGAAYNCDFSLQVNGGQIVTGLLRANKLYASEFLYNISSDRRLKNNIKPIEHALEKVASLRGYSFNIRKDKKRKYGVIAQDVQKIFPELVPSLGEGYIGVDYMGLIGPIVAAVHELKKENDALKVQLDKLQQEVRKNKK